MNYLIPSLLLLLIAAPYVAEAARRKMNADKRRDADGEFAELSHGVTHYTWSGGTRGPVAVCVHGLTTPSFVWQGMTKGLVLMGYRVLTYDLYGRGYSDRVPGRQDKAFFLQQLEDLLADQEVGDDVTLIGYSMGGAISTAFAAVHPDRIRQLVLIAPAGIGKTFQGLTRFIVRVPIVGDWLMLAFFPRTHRKTLLADRDQPSSVPGITDLILREMSFRGYIPAVLSSMRGILTEALEQEHRTIHRAGIPVLAIWGRDDSVIPLSAMGKMAEWSRSARHEVIDEAGHALTYSHTDDVLDAMRQALLDGPI